MRKLMTILVGIALLFSVSGIVGGQIDCTQCAKDGMKLAERHGISVYPCHDGHNSTSWVRFLQFPNKWAGKPAIIKDQHMILETKLPAGAKYTVYNVTRNFTLGPEVGSASSEDGLVTLVVGGKTYRATFRRFTVWYIAYFPASDFVRTGMIDHVGPEENRKIAKLVVEEVFHFQNWAASIEWINYGLREGLGGCTARSSSLVVV